MVGSILKAIDVVTLFNSERPWLTLGEMSKELGYPKTTVHSILRTLESRGFVTRDESGRYGLGTAFIPLTQGIAVNVELRDRGAPLLRQLADFSKQSVYLTVLDGAYSLYIYGIESPSRLLARTALGDRMPMHCTAVGKAVLAFLPYERVRAIIAEAGMETYTDNTVSSEQELFAELEKTRSRGFSTDNLEHNSWTYCVGAPIFNRRGEVFASCSVAGREPETVGAELEALSAAVRYTAQEISVRMGYVPRGERLIWRDAGNPLEPV